MNGEETWQVYGLGGELIAEYAANGAPASPQKEHGYRNGELLVTAELGTSGPTDLAANKTATQSSTYAGIPASQALDGNTSTVTHTNYDAQAWWQVDLGAMHSVQSVELWNRADCCGDRITNFNVILLDGGQKVVTSVNVPGQSGLPSTVQITGTAKYVKIQLVGTNYLSLAEVRVWGGAAPVSYRASTDSREFRDWLPIPLTSAGQRSPAINRISPAGNPGSLVRGEIANQFGNL